MNDILVSVGIPFLTTMATKGAEAPANTFNLLWKQIFGPMDVYLQKKEINRQNNLKKYVDLIEQATMLIPDEHIQEPKISILGPALEASKYYIEEDEIRELFSRLIASSMDDRKNELLHHSFVEVIKQMSPQDASLIELFKIKSTFPVTSIIMKNGNGKGMNTLIDLLFLENDNSYEANAICLTNLQRLGLIKIDFESFLIDDSLYEKYFDSHHLNDLKLNNTVEQTRKHFQVRVDAFGRDEVLKVNNLTSEKLDEMLIKKEPELVKGVVTITPLGKAFLKICY